MSIKLTILKTGETIISEMQELMFKYGVAKGIGEKISSMNR